MGWEYATLKRNDGTPIPRPDAQRSLALFRRAIALAGGRPPRDAQGRPMVWNEQRGWFSRDDRPASGLRGTAATTRPVARPGLRLRDAMAQQAQVQAKLDAEIRRAQRTGADLFARASETAIAFWKMFVKGRTLSPRDVSMDEMIGKQLACFFPHGRPSPEARQARFRRTGIWEVL